MREAFAGVDVAFAKGKRLPIVACTWEGGRLVPLKLRGASLLPPRGSGNVATLDDAVVRDFAAATAAYIEDVAREFGVRVVRIGLDAPSAPCDERLDRRLAERDLSARGISCFKTPTASRFEQIRANVRAHLEAGRAVNRLPHANQLWMLVGFALFDHLSRLCECIEVFPQATARVLGVGEIHKSKAGGVEAQLLAAARFTGWPSSGEGDTPLESIAWGPSHDCLDGYLSAWVAALPEKGRVAFGVPPADVIWVPRAGEGRFQIPDPNRAAEVVAEAVPKPRERRRSCPACQDFVFKRWPWGWDGHAAHACAGISDTDPELRKREFKRRFGHLW